MMDDKLAELRHTMETAVTDIDDMTAARILQRVTKQAHTAPPRHRSNRRTTVLVAAAAALAAAATVAIVAAPKLQAIAAEPAPSIQSVTKPTTLQVVAVTQLDSHSPTREPVERPARRSLRTEPGTIVHATVGDGLELELHGSADIALTPGSDGDELHLHSGKLIARYTAQRAVPIVIDDYQTRFLASHATVTVEVSVSRVEVIVHRGEIRIDDELVSQGQRWQRTAPTRATAQNIEAQVPATNAQGSTSSSPPNAPRTHRSAAQLYAAAERAARAGNHRTGRALLEKLLRRHPNDKLATIAAYELALAAQREQDYPLARQLAKRASQRGPLARQARLLACQIETDSGDTHAADACFQALRGDSSR